MSNTLLPKCLIHFALSTSGTTRILMLPYWPSATFWPLLFEKQNRFISIIQDVLNLPGTVLEQRLAGYGFIFKSQTNYFYDSLKIYDQTNNFELRENIPLYYFFIDLIKEHLIAHIDVNDSYLKKLLRDHAPSVIQNARRTNTLKSYRAYFSKWERWTERFEVKPLTAEDKYAGFTYST